MIANQNTALPNPFDALELAITTHDVDLYLRSTGMLTDEERTFMRPVMSIKTVKKGHFLLKEGQIAAYSYWILKGCVRAYYLKDGEEKTISFFTEGANVSANSSYVLQVPSKHCLECTEDTTLTVMSYANDVAFKKRFPRLAILCSVKTEAELGEFHDIAAEYIASTPEQRYLKLVDTRPDLLNRVPQYQLASYVGVTPESLSRIRHRLLHVTR